MPPLVSVVVPTHNRRALLERCMTALARQHMNAFEAVLVDDGSTDDTPRAAMRLREELPFDLKYVRQSQSQGPACARNQGWRAARGKLIAFTDDDCEPDPDWLPLLVQSLTDAAANIAGIGGRVEPATDGLISRYMTYHRILEPPPSCSYLVTANCIYRRSALEEVGGFDERVRTAGGEDPGLSFALSERGYRFGFTDQAVVRHNYREGLLDFARTFFRYGKGCRLVMDR
ncbi:glycosyltransferase [Archangium gephyra]|uniref:glycosyltransferase n=1 Tax=Archangium gephyra TaxID=48 RepID=UPI003B7CB00F